MKTTLKLFAVALLALANLAQAQTSFTIESPSERNRRGAWYVNLPVRPAPTYVNARLLAASTAESISIPATALFAVFSSDCNFNANINGTATLVTADVDNGTASEMNPSAWAFGAGQFSAISVIAAAACRVTVSFGL